MHNTYNIGSSRNQILLTVFITSPVPARSMVFITDPLNPTSQATEVVVSGEGSGDIINKAIGYPGLLKGKRLSVKTIVAIPGADIETRKKAAHCVIGDYLLEMGLEGLKGFSKPIKIINDDVTELILSLDADLI